VAAGGHLADAVDDTRPQAAASSTQVGASDGVQHQADAPEGQPSGGSFGAARIAGRTGLLQGQWAAARPQPQTALPATHASAGNSRLGATLSPRSTALQKDISWQSCRVPPRPAPLRPPAPDPGHPPPPRCPQEASAPDLSDEEQAFISTLNEDLQRFNEFFMEKEEDSVIRLQTLAERLGAARDNPAAMASLKVRGRPAAAAAAGLPARRGGWLRGVPCQQDASWRALCGSVRGGSDRRAGAAGAAAGGCCRRRLACPPRLPGSACRLPWWTSMARWCCCSTGRC